MSGELSLVTMATGILRHRRAVLWAALTFGLVVGLATLLRSRTYTARASFMSQTSATLSGVAALAAQVGFALPASDGDASPAFYASLLTSREVLEQAAESQYEFVQRGDQVQQSLVTLYDARGGDSAAQLDAAVRLLREALRVTIDRETGIVVVSVNAQDPTLAELVLERLLLLLAEFDQRKRQSRATAERRFVEARLQEADSSLKAAESRLQTFLQRNREFRSAPHLSFEHDRLQRAVAMQQQLFTGLAQAYEQARIDEVRNTPVLTIVEGPRARRRPDPRWVLLKTSLAVIVGGLLAALVALARESFAATGARESVDLAEFNALRDEAIGGIRRAAGRLGRAVGRHREGDVGDERSK